jgi:hypothetical protein
VSDIAHDVLAIIYSRQHALDLVSWLQRQSDDYLFDVAGVFHRTGTR